ncbi:MAG: hypothetical protein AVDCRST_MAG20-2286 [uncultured Acidimicrobiales bacterium]|uniref:Uncharacterized protein n=1 Tax=uncultured Acidimicrobiales bacterium TaxID=310071 RepID=A0A6J4IIX3_9ACTN|nr:MAG: hypothetical protein AVDCRST_MAG20-2286 [uncultured Acidimicrobiales bacterium]
MGDAAVPHLVGRRQCHVEPGRRGDHPVAVGGHGGELGAVAALRVPVLVQPVEVGRTRLQGGALSPEAGVGVPGRAVVRRAEGDHVLDVDRCGETALGPLRAQHRAPGDEAAHRVAHDVDGDALRGVLPPDVGGQRLGDRLPRAAVAEAPVGAEVDVAVDVSGVEADPHHRAGEALALQLADHLVEVAAAVRRARRRVVAVHEEHRLRLVVRPGVDGARAEEAEQQQGEEGGRAEAAGGGRDARAGGGHGTPMGEVGGEVLLAEV